MPKSSAVGLFCFDKFEEPPNKKVSEVSKLSKPYFKTGSYYRRRFIISYVGNDHYKLGLLVSCVGLTRLKIFVESSNKYKCTLLEA